ncbi:methionine ABC transporter ATP-binding protein [Jeotgalibacillus proteolyticus]|uniref:Phosphate ABC transporter ATP-binding protein n=1 Tax=Jeotgalibacillus proteolyticus TaxID=2082395 RepID=A0A2S5GC52_9BACL|nr:methionine ABC transporter ATP-binding protein [Jeotgalibacillus proteolyticus]PPA70576.1 phosphate ABC transporter ATP-binding protein [Jeotgalibacillus proteolyticus]
MIQFEGVTKTYGEGSNAVNALSGIDLTVETGEIFGVIGFSGAGKSSLIRCVNLLERPTKGKVFIHGKDLTSLSKREVRSTRKDIGMIFQHFNLLNSKTVFHNVAMPLLLSGFGKKEMSKRVAELLDFVGLHDKADQYPDQLSGGQKQRVGIARALATNPSVLLCDEATSALDPETTQSILDLLRKINKEYKITILIITHEMGVIREICDKVAVLENGVVLEHGSVFDVFTDPKHQTTQKFVRSIMNDHLPESILNDIRNKKNNHVYRIQFTGSSTGHPLLSKISREFDLDLNVLYGNITEIQGIPYGNLIVEFMGERNQIQKALLSIQQQSITVKDVIHHAS